MTDNSGAAASAAERTGAMCAADTKTLDRVLHADLSYIHSSGRRDGKQTHIDSIASGTNVYHSFDADNVRFIDLGADTVLRTGDARIEVTVRGARKTLNVAFVEVWTRSGGQWQLISWQSTNLPVA